MTLKRAFRLFLFAAVLFLIDYCSKSYVNENIPLIGRAGSIYPYGGIPIFHNFFGINFSIVHAMNKGAAWGMFASLQIYLLYFRIVVVGILFFHLLFFNKERHRDLPLTLIITGAIGNIVDYFVYGQVVDMFYFTFGSYSYPIFNIADSLIFCGITLLFLKSFFVKDKFDKKAKKHQS